MDISILILIPIICFFLFVFIYFLNKSESSYLISKEDVVGKIGKVILTLSEDGGLVIIKYDNNKKYIVNCQSYSDTIEEGQIVLITEYDKNKNMFKAEAISK